MSSVLGPAAIFIGTLLIRLPNLDHPIINDEFFHILAARSWVSDGSFAIADGEYPRAALFTMLVGWVNVLFGESLTNARTPALIAGSLLPAVLFVWLRRAAGQPAAWIGAILLALAPTGIVLSQFIRFYTPHALLFLIMAICCFAVVAGRASLPAKIGMAAAGLICTGLAVHLQVTTLVGLIGVAAWVGMVVLHRRVGLPWADRSAAAVWLAAVTAGLAVVLAAWASGIADSYIDRFRYAAHWATGLKDNVRFYHYLFMKEYPTLWTLLPLAAVVAIVRHPKLGGFCTLVFVTGIVLHSLAGMKHERYIYYLVPFFFAIWGIAAADLLQRLADRLSAFAGDSLRMTANGLPARTLPWAVIGFAILFIAASNTAHFRTARMVAGTLPYWERAIGHDGDWATAADTLTPLIRQADFILVTDGLKTLYHLGDFDMQLRPELAGGNEFGEEFGLDGRFGRPTITTDALPRVLACFSNGLLLASSYRWRNPRYGIDNAAANLLIRYAEEVVLPPEWNIRAFRWQAAPLPARSDCATLSAPAAASG